MREPVSEKKDSSITFSVFKGINGGMVVMWLSGNEFQCAVSSIGFGQFGPEQVKAKYKAFRVFLLEFLENCAETVKESPTKLFSVDLYVCVSMEVKAGLLNG